MEAYRELAEADRLPMRVYQQCNLGSVENLEAFLEKGHGTGDTCGNYRLGPLKIIADGSLGAHTAALLEPYRDEPETKGILNYTDRQLEELIRRATTAACRSLSTVLGTGRCSSPWTF